MSYVCGIEGAPAFRSAKGSHKLRRCERIQKDAIWHTKCGR
jgi:hypothetical protein